MDKNIICGEDTGISDQMGMMTDKEKIRRNLSAMIKVQDLVPCQFAAFCKRSPVLSAMRRSFS